MAYVIIICINLLLDCVKNYSQTNWHHIGRRFIKLLLLRAWLMYGYTCPCCQSKLILCLWKCYWSAGNNVIINTRQLSTVLRACKGNMSGALWQHWLSTGCGWQVGVKTLLLLWKPQLLINRMRQSSLLCLRGLDNKAAVLSDDSRFSNPLAVEANSK